MKIKRKMRSRAGMTLAELLAAVAVLGVLGAGLTAGVPAAARVYHEATADAEASVLFSTLSAAVGDELRYARSPKADGSFDSAVYGKGVSVEADGDGHLTVGGEPLLGSRTYTGNLQADISVSYEDGLFTVNLSVKEDGRVRKEQELVIRPVNEE
ncbi:type II secretion system protein [Agathobaculum sp.]|uniref:type II secretion system protein n=1 Tax=Agathobaculum sp. TaxID=2048138 RepID=UPI002A80AB1E|nr:type II secretion system protein [Agathobaculum sp.]MDY3617764.1 type II secretion system protein [Agathobaculum sp.]